MTLQYPDWGVPLLVKLNGKKPIDQSWNRTALSRWRSGDVVIRERWRGDLRDHIKQGGNIGLVVPPGLVALDADDATATAWLDEALPASPMQVTARGAHFLCGVPTDLDLSNGVKVVLFDDVAIDVRSAGRGHIVVAPSRHESGAEYCWKRELPERIEDVPPCPPFILEALRKARRANGNGSDGQPFSVPERIREGERQATLYKLGRSLKAKGFGEAEIRATLRTTVNETRCDPPLDLAEVQETAHHAATQPDRTDFNATGASAPTLHIASRGSEHDTDVGNAQRLVRVHGGELHYCHDFAKWFAWDGARWQPDGTAQAMRFAKDAVAKMYAEASEHPDEDRRKKLAKWASTSEAHPKLCAMLAQAQSEEGIPVVPDALDTEPMLFNVRNGTLDLERGRLRPHDRGDLLTKLAPVVYDPNASAPAWHAFLERVVPDEEVRAFLQRAIGYSLTGLTIEQIMFMLFGFGANGKTTFVETIANAMGDYWTRTPAETLLVKRDPGIPNDVARLRGARFVTAMELEEGRRLAEVRVKEITGGDTVSARFMRGEWFDFKPVCKLWLGTNHKPQIRGTDYAIWRRIHLVPFNVQIPERERDPTLPERFLGELPGILAWAVEGCIAWQKTGLAPPAAVLSATQSYREDEDVLGQFLGDCCVLREGLVATSDALYASYKAWAEPERPMSKKAFGTRLQERGLTQDRLYIEGKRSRAYRGIGLLDGEGRA